MPVSSDESSPLDDSSSAPTAGAETVVISLTREATSDAGQAGKIGAAHSVEDAEKLLEPGTYSLSLKTTGGLHSAYWFRFQDTHKGMLQIGEKARYIRLGETGKDAEGGIVIPQIDEYITLYTDAVENLSAGKEVQLVIS